MWFVLCWGCRASLLLCVLFVVSRVRWAVVSWAVPVLCVVCGVCGVWGIVVSFSGCELRVL